MSFCLFYLKCEELTSADDFRTSQEMMVNYKQGCQDSAILRAQNLAQNRPPYAEFGVLCRIEENLPNGAEKFADFC